MLYLVFSGKDQIQNVAVVEATDAAEAKDKARVLLPISAQEGNNLRAFNLQGLADGWVFHAES
jgi:hypothetical protein